MITRNEIKLLQALRNKKNREAEGLFIVEGRKILLEMMRSGLDIVKVYSTVPLDGHIGSLVTPVSGKELKRISAFVSPNELVALVRIPKRMEAGPDCNGLIIALDNIQDPGNFGTIIRTADWFGAATVLCSQHTVDVYNPKAVQASMGSVGRVHVVYTDLLTSLGALKLTHRVFGASIRGNSATGISWPSNAVVLIGNESAGLGSGYDAVIDEYIAIPAFGRAESLNAAVACSILSYEYRRKW